MLLEPFVSKKNCTKLAGALKEKDQTIQNEGNMILLRTLCVRRRKILARVSTLKKDQTIQKEIEFIKCVQKKLQDSERDT